MNKKMNKCNVINSRIFMSKISLMIIQMKNYEEIKIIKPIDKF